MHTIHRLALDCFALHCVADYNPHHTVVAADYRAMDLVEALAFGDFVGTWPHVGTRTIAQAFQGTVGNCIHQKVENTGYNDVVGIDLDSMAHVVAVVVDNDAAVGGAGGGDFDGVLDLHSPDHSPATLDGVHGVHVVDTRDDHLYDCIRGDPLDHFGFDT